MDPQLLRGAFRAGVLVLLVAVVTLPLQDRSSPQFVVTAMAAAVGLAFTLGVALLARLTTRDSRGRSEYKSRHRGRHP